MINNKNGVEHEVIKNFFNKCHQSQSNNVTELILKNKLSSSKAKASSAWKLIEISKKTQLKQNFLFHFSLICGGKKRGKKKRYTYKRMRFSDFNCIIDYLCTWINREKKILYPFFFFLITMLRNWNYIIIIIINFVIIVELLLFPWQVQGLDGHGVVAAQRRHVHDHAAPLPRLPRQAMLRPQ